MFQSARKPQTGIGIAAHMAELVYICTVNELRRAHSNAFVALGMNMLQAMIFVMIFYFMFSLLGIRGAALRGDFLIYIMSGVFLFMTHVKTLNAVVKSAGPADAIMQHAPMNTIVAIFASALSALYIQLLSLFLILFVYHVLFKRVVIEQPAPAFGMLMIAWFTAVALGILLLSIKPWSPGFVQIFSTVYQRANMIASGKMFVANALPAYMLALFDWNPLFHVIDQSRGFVFLNYFPRHSSWEYAVTVGAVLLVIGLMGEFYTRRHASVSWEARR